MVAWGFAPHRPPAAAGFEVLFARLREDGSGATESPDSLCSLVVILVSSFAGSAMLVAAAGWLVEAVGAVETATDFGFGAGCWFAKLSTMSAPGLDLPSLLASSAVMRGLDHKPVDGDETPLSLRWLYREFEPELAVLRTPVALPIQLL